MGHTGLSIISLCCILITFVAIAVSFSCPQWLLLSKSESTGLWLRCNIKAENIRWGPCRWIFDKNITFQTGKSTWFIAVQVLYSAALAFSVFAVIAASCTCMCRSNRANSVTCGLINFTFLLLVAAVATFGAMAYTKDDVRVSGTGIEYGWTFWVSVGSTGMALITTILYYCLSRVEDFGPGYKD